MTEERNGFYFELLELLEQDPEKRFYADNGKDLLRNKVYECAMKMDKDLIKLLLSNDRMKEKFFTDIDGTLVFDKTAFGWAINNKAFLQDSYTRFKNTIGLIDSKEQFISSKNDVVLSFPYKDCVLEGGQTKEDQKRGEIFYNELLAPDDVDRLLAPKVFTNIKRYTKDGEESITEFKDDDNLIIKGNNLLAITSLLKKHEGKIKCIYIDPPYNTAGDSNIFSYNNNYNHSTWLVFMKNRLETSKRLLKDDGFIIIAIDHTELFYLGTLVDEIFGRENFISIITVQHNPKGRNQSKFFSANSEFLLVYARNKELADFYQVAISDDVKATFTERDEKGLYRWESYIRARTVWSREARPDNWYPIYISDDLKTISSNFIDNAYELYPITNTGEFSWKNVRETFDKLNAEGNFRVIKEDGKIVLQHKYREQEVLKNVWVDKKYQSEFNGTNLLKELIGKNCFSYPKSLYAVVDIIKIMSGDNDIVLDFFGVSGTTAHAVLLADKEQNFKRKFILCEQIEEHIDIINRRLNVLIQKEDFPASYVQCELKQLNCKYINDIQVADDNKLNDLYKEITNSEFISYKADINKLKESEQDFQTLPIEDKRNFLIQVLDKNLLYVNYCDMEDEDLAVTEEEKAFARSFYGEGDRYGNILI